MAGGVQLVIEVDGEDAIHEFLDRLSSAQHDDLMQQVAGFVESGTRERIGTTKQDPDGNRWKPWSTSYAQRAKSKTAPKPRFLLFREGNLLDSIATDSTEGQAVVGTNLVSAATHQFGDEGSDSRGRKRNIPARAFLGISSDDAKEIESYMEDWVNDLLG